MQLPSPTKTETSVQMTETAVVTMKSQNHGLGTTSHNVLEKAVTHKISVGIPPEYSGIGLAMVENELRISARRLFEADVLPKLKL